MQRRGARWARAAARAGLAALVVALSACATLLGARALGTARPGGTTFHSLRVDGRQRTFLLHLPPAAASRRVPLLLAFHGYTGNANVMRDMSGLDAVADRLGFAVAYPNGTGALRYARLTWNAATCCGSAERLRVDDLAFARALVNAVTRALPVDPARVYATGFSAGGMMALLLACEAHPVVAGAADVAGAMPDTTCATRARMPILLVRGDRDDELHQDHLVHRRRNNHAYAVSFDGARRFWSAHDGCAPGAVRDSAATYELWSARGCPPGLDVRELVVRGQGHAWPGGARPWPLAPRPAPDVDASAVIARFFLDEARARASGVPVARAAIAP